MILKRFKVLSFPLKLNKFTNSTNTNFYQISTQIIKKYQQELVKSSPNLLKEYPKTFQEKAVIINNPKFIQAISIVQYGVKFKPGKKYLALILFLLGLFGYFHSKALPQKIVDSYFTISNRTQQGYWTGYLFSAFMFQNPYYHYLPLIGVIYQLSKFVKIRYVSILIALNMITCGIAGEYIVNERVKQYEVWDQQRIVYGEGNYLSLGIGFWSMLGFKGGFVGLKSRILLKSIPGMGIIRGGIPIGYIVCGYLVLLLYYHLKQQSRNGQLIAMTVINGLIWGLLMRRFRPLKLQLI